MLSERLLAPREAESDVPLSSLSLDAHIEHLERRLVRAALLRTGGRRSPAARLLGVSRNGLAMKMDRLGIDPRFPATSPHRRPEAR
jgi:DNA-binding NtrC family response regulator